jgi:hypothetical protein
MVKPRNETKSQISKLKELCPELRPRLRIFLSADIIGSTALKQAEHLPLEDPRSRWGASGAAPRWLEPIADFYTEFGQCLSRAWTSFSADEEPESSAEPPQLWKANGDELIFTKVLHSRRDLYRAVFVWKAAVKEYVSIRTPKRKVGIKCTAWVAGFPILNTEIVFPRGLSERDVPFEGEPRLRPLHYLSKWHKLNRKRSQSEYVLDFIGPQVDIGFRLGSQASARYMAISVDVAYLLSTATFPGTDGRRYEDIRLRYFGRRELKGVLGGDGYPLFVLDLADVYPNIKVFEYEDLLGGKLIEIRKDHVEQFCDQFYGSKSNHMFPPFMLDCSYHYTKLPDKYYDTLITWENLWELELNKARNDDAGDGISPAKAETVGSKSVDIESLERMANTRAGSASE